MPWPSAAENSNLRGRGRRCFRVAVEAAQTSVRAVSPVSLSDNFRRCPDGDTSGTGGLELGEVRVLIEGEHNAVITAPSIGSGAAMTALPAATKLWLAAGQNRPTGVFTNPPLDDNSYYHHWINACFGRETRLG
jgi:hypothetical protein